MVAITSHPEFIATPRPSVAAPPRLRLVGDGPSTPVVRVQHVPRFLLSLFLAVVAILATVSLMLTEPLADPGTIRVADATHVVTDGETMWSIALDVAPAGEAAGYVERLVAVNGGAIVVPGQVLTLPVP